MLESNHIQMLDFNDPDYEVEIIYRPGRLWVNIDGICRLRVTRIKPEVLNLDIVEKEEEHGN